MSWWGTIVGGTLGFLVGGPIGALLGVYAGRNFDSGLAQNFGTAEAFGPGAQQRVQATFFTTIFSVMGHIAKADGRISQDEIQLANRIMDEMRLTAPMKQAARDLFNKGKQNDFQFEAVLAQFRQEMHGRKTLSQMFLEIQIRAASADGELRIAEKNILFNVAGALGFSQYELESLISRHNSEQRFDSNSYTSTAGQLTEAYGILALSSSCSDKELKRTYRRLMAQHHPDKLVSKGLPDEMLILAKEKTQEIKAAYEVIKKARKK